MLSMWCRIKNSPVCHFHCSTHCVQVSPLGRRRVVLWNPFRPPVVPVFMKTRLPLPSARGSTCWLRHSCVAGLWISLFGQIRNSNQPPCCAVISIATPMTCQWHLILTVIVYVHYVYIRNIDLIIIIVKLSAPNSQVIVRCKQWQRV